MYTKMAVTTLIASAAVLAPFFSVHAEQERGTRLEAAFKKADGDSDGKLTRDEARSMRRVAKNFDAIDADKDGGVTLDEIRAGMMHKDKMHAGEMHGGEGMHDRGMDRFKAADKDSDGRLTRDEAKSMPQVAKNFDAMDADKDGGVSLDEIRASMMHKGKEMHDRGVQRFKSADKDNSGTLTRDEAKSMRRVEKNFDAIDADKDGTVSETEIHDFMKAQYDKHHMQ